MPVENGESVLGSLPSLESIEQYVEAAKEPTPTDRMISLHDALEEFYTEQLAKRGDGQ
jgi:hypothetical protein